jgi:ferric-dicitrate binding protein FerR (iron transport regulator)
MKSIDGIGFQSMDEIDRTVEKLLKEAYRINVYHTDLRELALYVDYDQEAGAWKKGRLELNQEQLRQLVANIETAIQLSRQWKLSSNQKS